MSIAIRAKNILLNPASEWEIVAREDATLEALYLGYVMPLAAIGPIATWIGVSLIGIGFWRVPVLNGLAMAIMSFLTSLAGVFLIAKLIALFSVPFNGWKNDEQALKLAVYASTPFWLAGILMVLPVLGPLAFLLSLYSIYLLYLGLPVVMKCPLGKRAPYAVAVVVGAVIIHLVLGAITAPLAGSPLPVAMSSADQDTLARLNALTSRYQDAIPDEERE